MRPVGREAAVPVEGGSHAGIGGSIARRGVESVDELLRIAQAGIGVALPVRNAVAAAQHRVRPVNWYAKPTRGPNAL